jgi:ribosomal protein S7
MKTSQLIKKSSNYYINKFVNVLMKKGKKALAIKLVKAIFMYVYRITKKPPIYVFVKAIKKGRPLVWFNINKKKAPIDLSVDPVKLDILAKSQVKVYLIKKYDTSIFYFFTWLVRGTSKLDKERNVVKRLSVELIKLAESSPESYILRHKKRVRAFILRGVNTFRPQSTRLSVKPKFKISKYLLIRSYIHRARKSFIKRLIYRRIARLKYKKSFYLKRYLVKYVFNYKAYLALLFIRYLFFFFKRTKKINKSLYFGLLFCKYTFG